MKIKSKLLRAAQVCQATNEIRYYLNGIHIKDNIIQSTNGHVCVRMTMEDKVEVERIVNIKGKIPKKAYESLFIFDDEPIVKHYDSFGRLMSVSLVEVVDGKFPDVDRVMPDDKNKSAVDEIGINPSYINFFHKMFNVTGIAQAKIEFYGKDKSIKLTSINELVNIEYGNPVFIVEPCRMGS